MNRLLFFILVPMALLAMEESPYWQKYKERSFADEDIRLSAQILWLQGVANSIIFCKSGAVSKVLKLDLGYNISPNNPMITNNNYRAWVDKMGNRFCYLALNASNMGNFYYSMPLSSIYFEEAYENRNNLTKCASNAFMGAGLATNSLLISAGGANNLTSNSSVKSTLYGVSTAATAMETFNHAKQAYSLWNKDRTQAWEHIRYAGLFATFGVMPFVLDSYQKKVTQ